MCKMLIKFEDVLNMLSMIVIEFAIILMIIVSKSKTSEIYLTQGVGLLIL